MTRTDYGYESLFKGLSKIFGDKIDKMTEIEMSIIYDYFSLSFENYYGYAIPLIGALTKYGKQEVFNTHLAEIRKKILGMLEKMINTEDFTCIEDYYRERINKGLI